MATYPIIRDFGFSDSSEADSISVSPAWLLVVIRLKYPLTYSHVSGHSYIGFEKSIETQEMLLIDSDCVSLTVSSSKSSYLTTMQATLVPGQANYLSEILPGDYVFAWMANDPKTIEDVKKKILKGDPANEFRDGLKFMGRVQTLQKSLGIDPTGGAKHVQYSLSANGFTEFNASVFYEPQLAQRVDAIGEYWAKLGVQVNELIKKGGRGLRGEDAIVTFLDLLIGRGVNKNFGMENAPLEMRSTAGLEAKHSFIIPKEVGSIIGKTETSQTGGILAAADLLEVIHGVQEYSEDDYKPPTWNEALDDNSNNKVEYNQIGELFSPKNTRHDSSRRFTGTYMLGTFPLTPPQFSGAPVWGILNNFLNPAVNEMYACLRANYQGKVVPTVVVRQIPFTSNSFSLSTMIDESPMDKNSTPKGVKLPVTRFLDLPRWGVDPVLVKSYSLGRSDALRFNFVHIYGNMSMTKADSFMNQVVINPPKRDDVDIARSGLRPYQMTVSCHFKDVHDSNPGQWMAIMSDILMGQHLTLTGNLEMIGVQSPICPGDNLEFDNVVFHIETVAHSCSIGMDGKKRFSTIVALSHGVSAEPEATRVSRYAGIQEEDQRALEPGYTHDTGNSEYDSGRDGFESLKSSEEAKRSIAEKFKRSRGQ